MKQFVSFCCTILMLVSCKNDTTTEITDTAAAKSLIEHAVLSVFRESLDLVPGFVADGSSATTKITLSSSEDLDNSTYPKVITIDFGAVNQMDQYGINRRGKILVTLKSNGVLSSDFTVGFSDFYLNDSRLLGALNVTYSELSSQPQYELNLGDSLKLQNQNGVTSLAGSLMLNRESGESTLNVGDDVYSYSESTTGQDFAGRSFVSKTLVNSALNFKCGWIFVNGESELTPFEEGVQKVKYNSRCEGTIEVESEDEESSMYFQLN